MRDGSWWRVWRRGARDPYANFYANYYRQHGHGHRHDRDVVEDCEEDGHDTQPPPGSATDSSPARRLGAAALAIASVVVRRRRTFGWSVVGMALAGAILMTAISVMPTGTDHAPRSTSSNDSNGPAAADVAAGANASGIALGTSSSPPRRNGSATSPGTTVGGSGGAGVGGAGFGGAGFGGGGAAPSVSWLPSGGSGATTTIGSTPSLPATGPTSSTPPGTPMPTETPTPTPTPTSTSPSHTSPPPSPSRTCLIPNPLQPGNCLLGPGS